MDDVIDALEREIKEEEEESKDIFAILTYTHLLVSKMVATYLNTNDETVMVKMTPTYEDRLTKLFYIAKPQNVRKRNINYILNYNTVKKNK
jgi:hypothetical protein